MGDLGTVLLIILGVVLVAMVVLYFVGKKLQKKQETSETQMKAAAQTVSILVIDKKKMKLKDAQLPKIVYDQTPRYMRGSKLPIVKAKIGPKVMSLICDAKVYEVIPVKKEVKAVISGIYIMDVKGLRTNLDAKKVKLSLMQKVKSKLKKDN